MSFETVPASELMLKRGGSVNPLNHLEETFELLSISAFDKGAPEILKGKDIGSSKSCIQPNDVLISKIVPHIKRCCVVRNPVGNYRQIGSGEWIIFRSPKFYPDYLKHFLTSDIFHKQFMNTTAGVGGSLVRARPAGVEKIEIPLPPLEEQKRIAAILDKADAIRRKRQEAIKLADEFLRAVFLDMFGDPVANTKNWPVKKWGDAGLIKIINGRNQSQVLDPDGEYPIIGSGGEMGRANNYLCPENTIVIGRKGNINKPLLIKEKFWNVDTAFGLIPNLNELSFNYLYWFCVFFDFERLNKTVTIPSLTKSDLLEIAIPVPDRTLQDKFDYIVTKITSINNQQATSLKLSNSSFNSLSDRLFKNEN